MAEVVGSIQLENVTGVDRGEVGKGGDGGSGEGRGGHARRKVVALLMRSGRGGGRGGGILREEAEGGR